MRKALLQWLMMALLIGATPVTLAVEHQGVVQETIAAGAYTYMKVEEDGQSYWIAGPANSFAKGSVVTFGEEMWMSDFTSKALGRSFERLLFVNGVQLVGAEQGTVQPAATSLTDSDLYTVEQVYAQKAQLKGKVIAVRGKVVKVSRNILRHNWIHIQDGTGVPGSNDLLFRAEKNTAKFGAIVTARGRVDTERDFGAGYYYPLLIEDSEFSP